MVSAKFTYREFVAHNDLPIDMTSVVFYGSDKMEETLDTLKNLVQFDRTRLSDYEITIINDFRNGIKEKVASLQQQMAEIKKSNRFMMFKKGDAYIQHQELSKQMSSLLDEDASFVDKIDALDEDRFYGQKEMADKFSNMLDSLGFQRTSSKVDERGIVRAIYDNPMSDEELMVLANNMLAQLEEQFETSKVNILTKYNLPIPTNTGAKDASAIHIAEGTTSKPVAVEESVSVSQSNEQKAVDIEGM